MTTEIRPLSDGSSPEQHLDRLDRTIYGAGALLCLGADIYGVVDLATRVVDLKINNFLAMGGAVRELVTIAAGTFCGYLCTKSAITGNSPSRQ